MPTASRATRIPRENTIPAGAIELHRSSFQDPSGRLFFWEGDLYRGIHAGSAAFYRHVTTLPVIRDLCERGLLVRTRPSELMLDEFPLVLEHVTVPFVTYPFEWCSAMLRDAALLVLDIMDALAPEGLCLRSPSPWDVLFAGSHPLFVDFTAIRPIHSGSMGRDYDRFRRGFVFPLSLMNGRRERVARWLLHDPAHGVSPGDFARMAPHQFITMKARELLSGARPMLGRSRAHRESPAELASWEQARPEPHEIRSHMARLRLLRQEVAATRPRPRSSIWSAYYEEHADITFPDFSPGADWNAKHRNIYDLLRKLKPATVNSFGCNRGWYEQQAARLGAQVVCSDVDGPAISLAYSDARRDSLPLLPLILDVLSPSPGLGVGNDQHPPAAERLRCDLVMALALAHHLVLEHKLSFEQVVASLSAFTNRWLLIEFVPADDAHLTQWCPETPAWYTLDRFEAVLGGTFRSIVRLPSFPAPRLLLLCEK